MGAVRVSSEHLPLSVFLAERNNYVDYSTKVKAAGLNGYKDVKPTHDVSKDNAVTVSVQIGNDSYKGTLTRE